jgi:outer membrane receptor protein involved in Fe transport
MNGQDAEIRGFEWDIHWALTDQLAVTFAGDVIDSEITKVDPANLQPRYLVGDHISLVPEYQLSASADYRFDWFGSAPGSFLLSFNRQGESHFYNRNFALLLVHEATALEKNFLNASLGAEWNGWELNVFGRNLLDEDEILNANTNGWTAQARPRTFGFGVKKTF